jgi:hypothetical protein
LWPRAGRNIELSEGVTALSSSPLNRETVRYWFKGRNVPPMLAVTVKSFEQQELHATVTIRPKLEIPNQKLMQK